MSVLGVWEFHRYQVPKVSILWSVATSFFVCVFSCCLMWTVSYVLIQCFHVHFFLCPVWFRIFWFKILFHLCIFAYYAYYVVKTGKKSLCIWFKFWKLLLTFLSILPALQFDFIPTGFGIFHLGFFWCFWFCLLWTVS